MDAVPCFCEEILSQYNIKCKETVKNLTLRKDVYKSLFSVIFCHFSCGFIPFWRKLPGKRENAG